MLYNEFVKTNVSGSAHAGLNTARTLDETENPLDDVECLFT